MLPLAKRLHAWLPVAVLVCLALLVPVRGGDRPDEKGEKDKWSYSGKDGPENWHTINPNWAVAKLGKRQSPINPTKAKAATFSAPKVNYEESPLAVLNNGNTIEVPYAAPAR